jgi:hypothetical protein
MNFKIHFDKGCVRVKSINDDEFDLEAVANKCLIVNPCFPTKSVLVKDIKFTAIMPMNTSMLKYFGNYDISV